VTRASFAKTAMVCFALAWIAPACSASPQWLVTFSTNARVPRMGDRLQVDVLDENGQLACAGCTNRFELQDASDNNLSIGIAQTDRAVRVRARLYRVADESRTSETRTIDVVARLPALDSDTLNVTFPVPIECFGRPPDLTAGASCRWDPASGFAEGPEPMLSAEPHLSAETEAGGCTKSAPDGMRCVGTGTILMGDERVEALAFEYSARPESVQRVAPGAALMFDVDEVRVGTVRDLVRRGRITPGTGASGLLLRGAAGTREDQCTWVGQEDPRFDAMPINCIGRDLARSVCSELGRRLPFEYEWELAAGDGPSELLYPWEATTPLVVPIYDNAFSSERLGDLGICEVSVVARGRSDRLDEAVTCVDGKTPGPVIGGSDRDVTSAGIKNLGGNVSEWVDDELALYDEECWSRPLGGACRVPSKRIAGPPRAPYRGGSWSSAAHAAMSVARFAHPDGSPSPAIGFRCAITEDALP
jgi:hypothetical protein